MKGRNVLTLCKFGQTACFQPEDDYQPVIPKNLGLTLDMLVPRMGQRTLWCEIPEVQSSGILGILSDNQKQLQEAIFEILTSEVSYLKSLDVLISLFYENRELVQVLTEEDRAALFGNITFGKDEDEEASAKCRRTPLSYESVCIFVCLVKDCAQAFLAELLGKWEESWYIQEVGQVINDNANSRFSVYKDYCRNKPYQDKTLQRLR
jgi:neuronal guanine nucleotide exchange factor